MPKGAISVCRPGPFGNPFKTAKEFRDVLEPLLATSGSFNLNCNIEDFGKMSGIAERLPELRGKTLACWCGLDKECHADVLAEYANKER